MRRRRRKGVRTQIPGGPSPSSSSPSSGAHAGCLLQGEREIVRELLHGDRGWFRFTSQAHAGIWSYSLGLEMVVTLMKWAMVGNRLLSDTTSRIADCSIEYGKRVTGALFHETILRWSSGISGESDLIKLRRKLVRCQMNVKLI